MAIDIKKIIEGTLKIEPPKPSGVCRIELPDGGIMEVRTGGNIDLGDGTDIKIAEANYRLGDFEENYHNYFMRDKAKPGPSSGVK